MDREHDGGKGKEYRIFGPPGTGKTTTLARQIGLAAQKHGSDAVFVTSFTRAAAAELIGRDLPLASGAVGTLHSHCFRALGQPQLAEVHIKQWNQEFPHYALSGGLDPNLEESSSIDAYATDAAAADAESAEYHLLRNKLVPREKWPNTIRAFAKQWEGWCSENDYTDFTGLIERGCKDMLYPPNGARIGFVDEAQDLTPLQLSLVRAWGKQLDYFILVGDDDQCQPPGTKVCTTEGQKNIEDLDPEMDRLLSYSRNDSLIYGARSGGYAFKKAVRKYRGHMHKVVCGDRSTRATPNHIWLARWDKEALAGKVCTYLMRRGEDFRVGWCAIIRSDGCFHLGVRARLEAADEAWVLTVHNDRAEASIMESYIAAKYGITTAMFKSHGDRSPLYSQDGLDKLFSMLRGGAAERAARCLLDHGRAVKYPLWSQKDAMANQGGASIFKVRTCNMLPGLMKLPVRKGDKVLWVNVSSNETEDYDGEVWSLDVEKYHTYVADGIATHNCLYSFTGATSEAFLNPPLEPEYKRVLGQSHRVPAKVQSLAVKWIKKIKRREEKQYLPRDHEGEVRVCEDGNFKRPEPILEDAQKYLAKGKTVMFLAPCSYQLSPLVKLLRSEGIPFHNPYRRSRGDWNPLAPRKGTSATDRLISFIEPNGPRFGEDTLWDIRQLYAWTDVCASEGLLVHGAKTKIKALAKKEKSLTLDQVLDVYTDLFIPEGLDAAIRLNPGWLFDQLRAGFSERMRFPLEILRRLGREALREEPQCIVGTVHSVKGGQADAVYVVPDISLSNWKACQEDAGARDSVVRLMYVAMTRARESLIITGAATPCNPLAAISGGLHA